jgi:hypothetical protein
MGEAEQEPPDVVPAGEGHRSDPRVRYHPTVGEVPDLPGGGRRVVRGRRPIIEVHGADVIRPAMSRRRRRPLDTRRRKEVARIILGDVKWRLEHRDLLDRERIPD